ncbi:phosphatase PAP2 family protein [bacterium]|nr:MAG: phosphatase PAP2 family protein [bacterium]
MIPGELPLFRAINRGPEAWEPVMKWFSTATDAGWFKIALAILVLGMIVRGGKARPAAILSLLAFPIANLITDLFKKNYPGHRPFQVIEDVIVRTGRSDSMGTASAHSANMAAIAVVMTGILGWRWGAAWIVVAFLTGYSRIYNGVHWPSQVTLGWIVGTLVGLGTVWAYGRVLARRNVKNEGDAKIPA